MALWTARSFISLSLECNAPDDVLAWANSLLSQHANRRAWITTHMDLGIVEKPKTAAGYRADPKGRMRWVNLRLLRFRPKENHFAVLTYEVHGRFLVDGTVYGKDRSQHQFTIPYFMTP